MTPIINQEIPANEEILKVLNKFYPIGSVFLSATQDPNEIAGNWDFLGVFAILNGSEVKAWKRK